MAEGACVHLEVALEWGSDTIRGTVDNHSGSPMPFSGWLEFMSALETVRARVSGSASSVAYPCADAPDIEV